MSFQAACPIQHLCGEEKVGMGGERGGLQGRDDGREGSDEAAQPCPV